MPSTITPNMGLIVPGVGTEPGPTWANDLNASLGILDQHNHSTGQGVQITPSGLNINADLPLNANNLILVKTVNFTSLGSSLPGTSPNLGCVYVAGNELYYNDESGNVVPITNNGSVNAGAGSITGLPSGTASASYSSLNGTFIFQSATSTPANIDGASIIVRDQTANSKGVTISAPNSLAADYNVFLPSALPGITELVTLDSAGNIGASTNPNFLTPTGGIIMYGGSSAPSGYLLCDGSAVSRSSFSGLFAAIATNYGIGDGSTTFNVPDLRGLFPRGVSGASGNDPDAAGRTATNGGNSGNAVGSFQSDEFASHTHDHNIKHNSATGASDDPLANNNSGTTASYTSANATGGNETRPKNVYVNFIIKT